MNPGSYIPTQKLLDLKVSHPEAGTAIEQLCFALMASRGPLQICQCFSVLAFVNKHLTPWVEMLHYQELKGHLEVRVDKAPLTNWSPARPKLGRKAKTQ